MSVLGFHSFSHAKKIHFGVEGRSATGGSSKRSLKATFPDNHAVSLGHTDILHDTGHAHESIVQVTLLHAVDDSVLLLSIADHVSHALILVGKLHLVGHSLRSAHVLGSKDALEIAADLTGDLLGVESLSVVRGLDLNVSRYDVDNVANATLVVSNRLGPWGLMNTAGVPGLAIESNEVESGLGDLSIVSTLPNTEVGTKAFRIGVESRSARLTLGHHSEVNES